MTAAGHDRFSLCAAARRPDPHPPAPRSTSVQSSMRRTTPSRPRSDGATAFGQAAQTRNRAHPQQVARPAAVPPPKSAAVPSENGPALLPLRSSRPPRAGGHRAADQGDATARSFRRRVASSAGLRRAAECSCALRARPARNRQDEAQDRHHPVAERCHLPKRLEQPARQRLGGHRAREAGTGGGEKPRRTKALPPPLSPTPQRPQAHLEDLLQAGEPARRWTFHQDRQQQHHHAEVNFPSQETQRRRRCPPPAALDRTAEAVTHCVLRRQVCRTSSGFAPIVRSMEHATASRTAGLPNLIRAILITPQQLGKEAGIQQQTLVQGVVSFRLTTKADEPSGGGVNPPGGLPCFESRTRPERARMMLLLVRLFDGRRPPTIADRDQHRPEPHRLARPGSRVTSGPSCSRGSMSLPTPLMSIPTLYLTLSMIVPRRSMSTVDAGRD